MLKIKTKSAEKKGKTIPKAHFQREQKLRFMPSDEVVESVRRRDEMCCESKRNSPRFLGCWRLETWD